MILGLPFEWKDITYDILKLKKRSKAVQEKTNSSPNVVKTTFLTDM